MECLFKLEIHEVKTRQKFYLIPLTKYWSVANSIVVAGEVLCILLKRELLEHVVVVVLTQLLDGRAD